MPVKGTRNRRLIRKCSGRDPDKLPPDGFNTALFLTGRRSGKSRIAAVIGAHAAVLSGLHKRLSPGETGMVPVVCPTKQQGRIVSGYLRALCNSPILSQEIESDTRDQFRFKNGIVIEVLPGDFRHVRGYTLLAVVVDEIAFFGLSEEQKLRSDTELVRALKPALATTQGRLICIGSPYARKGWCFDTYRRHHGNDNSRVLVWNAPSRTMNPTLSEQIVKDALAEDYAAARAEYLGEFRDDVGLWLPRDVITKLVVKGRFENLPRDNHRYFAFADISGGRSDSSALAIGHQEQRKVVIDYCKEWKAPNNPHQVIACMAEECRRFRIRHVTGDAFGAGFSESSFNANGIGYKKHSKNKSALYGELLPIICAGEVELLDNDLLVSQLASLERRTRSGAKDLIDHPPRGHDDLANAVAGCVVVCSAKRVVVGAGGF